MTELIGNICCVDYKNEFVIDGNGDFYKCWNEIGLKDKVIRNFNEEFNTELENMYLHHNSMNNFKCANCRVLPLGMGGCIYHFSEKDNCSIYLHNIEKTIRKYVDYHFDLR